MVFRESNGRGNACYRFVVAPNEHRCRNRQFTPIWCSFHSFQCRCACGFSFQILATPPQVLIAIKCQLSILFIPKMACIIFKRVEFFLHFYSESILFLKKTSEIKFFRLAHFTVLPSFLIFFFSFISKLNYFQL